MPAAASRRPGRPRIVPAVAALGLASAAAAGTVVVRGFYTAHTFWYQALLWNLVLAWIPALAALAAHRAYRRESGPGFLFGLCLLVWFLFFPNAPYIVTDFVHLAHQPPVPLWYDLLMIASFAWTGLSLGYLSLYLVQEIARARFGRGASWVFAVGMLALGSVGVYAGRVLRWNSWDVFRHPSMLLHEGVDLAGGAATSRLAVVAFVSILFLFLVTTYCATFALMGLREESP